MKKENYPGFRITELWIFVSIDEDGDEGVMAMAAPSLGGAIPLIAADEERRTELEPIARDIAHVKGSTYECRHFVRG